MTIRKNILILFFFSFTTTSFCQELKNNKTDSVINNRLVELETFVITAQYEKIDQEKSINKIKVIDREKIESLGAVNLKDVLAFENNIRLSQDNILGSSMSLQGVSGQNIKILIDGIPVIGRLNGNVDISQINLNNIEQIEIVEGPLSVNYGTDALAGTINLISKKSSEKKFSFNLNSYYETVGQYNLDASAFYKLKKGSLNISGGRNFFDGWNSEDVFMEFPISKPADFSRFKEWKPKEQLFSKIEYSLSNDNSSIRTFVNLFDEKITNRGIPRSPYFETAFDDYYYTWRKDVGLDYNKKLESGVQIRILGGFNNYKRIKNTYFKDLTTLEQQQTSSSEDQDTTKFNTLLSRGTWTNLIGKHNYQIGYELNHESGDGKRIEGNVKTQSDYALFGSYEFKPIEKLIIKPAVRFTYNSMYKAPVIPSINFKYQTKHLNFRSSYARGFRAPSLKELYFNFVDINHNIVGNKDLSAEQSNNFSADIVWSKKTNEHIIQIDFGAFYNDIDNLITLAQSGIGNQFTYFNLTKNKTTGIQLNGSLKHEKLNINVGVANIGRYNSLSDSTKIPLFNVFNSFGWNFSDSTEIPSFCFTPEIRINVIYTIPKLNVKISSFYKYTGRTLGFFINSDGEVSQSEISNFNMFDLNFSKTFNNDKIILSIGGKNLFDVQSITSNNSNNGVHSSNSGSIPMSWGRSFFTSFKLNF